MSLSSQQSALNRRLFLRSNSSPRRSKFRSRFIPELIELEDRCLLSYTPTLVPSLTSGPLSQVFATPANLPVKLVTIMNNSDQMVYPILQDANSTLDGTATKVVRINLTNGGSGYNSMAGQGPTVTITGGGGSGATAEAVVNGQGQIYALNLESQGIGYTSTPTVTFSGGGGSGATATAALSNLTPSSKQTSLYDPLDAYNQSYRGYIGEYNPATGQVDFGLLPGTEVTVQVPLAFWDGGRLFLASNGSQPYQSPTDPGNPLQNTAAWTYNAAAASFLVAPNMPYGATFADPATGIANPNGRVMWYHDTTAHDFATDASGQLTEWTIRDPQLVNYAPNMPSSQVLTIFNYDVSYVDNLTLPAAMEITNVPIQTPPGYDGPAIPTATYAALGTDLTIAQMQQGMTAFTSTDPSQLNADLGTYFGGRGYDQFYFPSGANGINFDKLPAGYNLIALSPNAQVASSYDPTKFQLVSGGSYAQVDTRSTGIATKGSNQITDVSAAQAALLAPGMEYQIVNFPIMGGTMPIFPQGTYITSVVGTTINMSQAALQNGPDQSPGNQLSYTFVGSQFTSTTGTTNGTIATITGIDPTVGIYLSPGMLVTGPGITTYTQIQSISADYKTVTLTGAIPAAGSGSYVFTGAPSSYVVSTLINNWYSWADYYVNNVNATAQMSTGNAYGPGPKLGLADPNSLTLYGLSPSVVSQLKVGDVVTGPGIATNPTMDPTKNTTISAILSATSVQLSNPVTMPVTNGSYSFSPPVKIARSSDAQPYTLTFTTQAEKDNALAFAQSVYDVMQGFSHLSAPTYLSQSALLLDYVIGGNIGTFILQGQVLPDLRLNQLRDELKSVLRGVANFNLTPEFSPTGAEQWYPDPSQGNPTNPMWQGAMINGLPATFGVYNLNPYVWFIHIKLGMSGYGFSLDDDTANAQDAASSLQLAYGGTKYTAPSTAAPQLENPELYTYGAPFGTLQDQGYIDTTSGVAKGYDLTKFTVINGLSLATVGKLKAFDASNGQGALVTGAGMTVGLSRVYYTGPTNPIPNNPMGANSSYVVLMQPSPDQSANPAPSTYTFSGFNTTLPDGTQLSSPVPAIASFTPPSGAVGSSVTLTGSAFTKTLGVTFNGFPAVSFTVNSDASITVTVPVGATSGLIGVRGPAGTGYTRADFTVTGGTAPTLVSFTPPSGSLGTVVTLTGTGFTGATAVTFNGTPADAFSVTNDTTLKATVPIGATTGTIVVTTPSGVATSATNFTVNPPSITSFSPPRGAVGATVTLTGTGFTGATAVTFSGTPATSYTVLSDTSIQATVPAGAATGPIAVATSGGTGTSATSFTVTTTVTPSITSFSPPSGTIGTVVTLTGAGFTGATAVTFNGIAAASFTVMNDTTIQATVPTLATTGAIAVTNSAGTGASATNFTVTAAVFPTITSFSPQTGPVGTSVTLTGTGFTGATDVSFGGIEAGFIVINDTTINTTVPNEATSGIITVTNSAGTGFSPTSFIVEEDTAAHVAVSAGSPQSTLVDAAFGKPLQALVTDSSGNPIGGISVQFVAPSGGASGTFANGSLTETDVTNASGVATSSTFTANLLAGKPYVVMASVAGVGSPANFSLTNQSPLGPTANAIYVQNVYGLLLDRVSDGQMWVNLLDSGTSPAFVVQEIEGSSEYLKDLVNGLYLHYLNRPGESSALDMWANMLANGVTIEQVTEDLVSSAEYFSLHGGTNAGFVAGLYEDILGRTASAGDIQGWVNALNNGVTRDAVAVAFLVSREYRIRLVDSYYNEFLRRPADPAGQAAAVAALAAGAPDQEVLASIFGSPEGYALWS